MIFLTHITAISDEIAAITIHQFDVIIIFCNAAGCTAWCVFTHNFYCLLPALQKRRIITNTRRRQLLRGWLIALNSHQQPTAVHMMCRRPPLVALIFLAWYRSWECECVATRLFIMINRRRRRSRDATHEARDVSVAVARMLTVNCWRSWNVMIRSLLNTSFL